MNDDQLEQQLRELPAPALPESWRDSILAAARREVSAPARPRETWPTILIYLRHLFARNPVTAGALTAIWLLIFLFKAATPVDPMASQYLARIDPSHPPRLTSLAEEIRLAESWQEEPRPDRIP